MKRIIIFTLGFLLSGIILAEQKPAPKAQKPKEPKFLKYTIQILSKGQPVQTMTTYKSDDKYRFEVWEGEGKGKKLKIIYIQKGDAIYIISPKEKMIMIVPRQREGMAGLGRIPNNLKVNPEWDAWVESEGKSHGVKKIKTEKWQGEVCDVYRAMNLRDKSYVDLYVERKSKMIKKWIYYDATNKVLNEMRLLEYSVNKPIKSDKFEIPKGYQVQDMRQMPMYPAPPPPK